MMKLIGAALVILACSAFGIKYVLKKRETLSAIRQLRDLFTELARAIGFTPEPLPDILQKIKKQICREESGFLDALLANIEKEPSNPISSHWQNALNVFDQESSLPKEVKNAVSILGDALGKSDLSTELQRLNQTGDSLTEILNEMEKNQEKTEKTVKSLGVLSGVSIVILLL